MLVQEQTSLSEATLHRGAGQDMLRASFCPAYCSSPSSFPSAACPSLLFLLVTSILVAIVTTLSSLSWFLLSSSPTCPFFSRPAPPSLLPRLSFNQTLQRPKVTEPIALIRSDWSVGTRETNGNLLSSHLKRDSGSL